MTTNDALMTVLPDVAVDSEAPEELFMLLRDRIQRYTMGDSTSVPMETAQRLLESIAYCADLNRRFPVKDVPADAPLHTRWQAGVRTAKRIAARANLLLHQAQRTPPPVPNIAYRDTVAALPSFFRAYDADFFAREIPCSFDYPLCAPIPDTLYGAEYIAEYLRRLLVESQLLCAFSPEALRALYERYYEDYDDLLVNLCLPAAEMTLLCALAGRSVRALALDTDGYAVAGEKMGRMVEDADQEELHTAAGHVMDEMNIGGSILQGLLVQVGRDLATRLRASRILQEAESWNYIEYEYKNI